MEVVAGKGDAAPEACLGWGRGVARLLAEMEERGLAHCDLSGPNLILTPEGGVELVDLEEMYSPELVRPKALPGGSPGYAHKTAPDGLWRHEADRFAGAVLLAEILGWCDARARATAWGEGYFDPAVLAERWGERVAGLFDRAWFSETLAACPTFAEWLAALPERIPEQAPPAVRGPQSDQDLSLVVYQAGEAAAADDIPEALHLYRAALPRAGGELGVLLRRKIAQLELIFGDRVGQGWTCSGCGQSVGAEHDTCPHCEKGTKPREPLAPLAADPTLVSQSAQASPRTELGGGSEADRRTAKAIVVVCAPAVILLCSLLWGWSQTLR